ncbi:MAG: thioredoxin domain-containing protein [Chloroflexi bacterium]|nr:thioredoxin domain-containing protein [Chloroflexota bacterium]MCL5273841.1 thioredoxin domain-containing protein [Chloroflexota bacterium]
MPNRLAGETSPYLQQHADNPVDWYPWGDEALHKARAEDKSIFLSIGYAACHWCHVMAHESFEDAETAALMNRHFICIKVDREERPDLDAIYMQATVAITGQGGWPMSVFLTPEGVPFYAGTYFPNTPRHGLPSFKQVLISLSEAWVNRRADVERTTVSLRDYYRQESHLLSVTGSTLNPDVPAAAVKAISAGFDRVNGGWGNAPKFPQPMTLEFLLSYHASTGDAEALQMVESTLSHMAAGGVYDHLGGGFHRYSTDSHWLAPHFEKMLYDNSQLARVYLHAWQVTGNDSYRRVATETLDYVAREMTHPDGGFYSTQDADSEGVEGKFFVWTPDEIRDVIGDSAELFCAYYDVTRRGNFEGRNILHSPIALDEFAVQRRIKTEEVEAVLADARGRLFAARSQRIRPGRDEKVLTAWNGLMLAAFAEAARALHRNDYLSLARRNADFVLQQLRTSDGRLLRSWKAGSGARLNGYLEDYSNVVEGLLALYQTTFELRWFTTAREIADSMIAHFAAGDGTFYDTSDDHEALITRPHDLQDNAVPAGNSMAATALLKLAALTGESHYSDTAEQALSGLQDSLSKYPTAFGQWLVAFELALRGITEVAIVGDPALPTTQAMIQTAQGSYTPNRVAALLRPGEQPGVPLLDGRASIDGKPTAYVCRNFTCQMPVTDLQALKAQLQ